MSSYLVYVDQLEGEYKTFFKEVENYALLHNVDSMEVEEGLSNLLDMLLVAQTNNEPLSSVCEEDTDTFCENYFNHPNTLKNKIHQLPHILFYLSIALFAFGSIDLICVDQFSDIFTVKTSIAPMLEGVFIAIVVSTLIHLLVEKLDKKHKIKAAYIFVVDIIISFIVVYFIVSSTSNSIMMNALTFECITLMYICLYKGSQFYKRYKDHGNIFKSEYEKSISLRSIFKDTMTQELESGSLERDFLKNQLKVFYKKHARKGITEEEFDQHLDKELYWMEVENKYMWIVFVGFIIIATFINGSTGDSLVDTLIFGGILTVVEGVVYKFFLTVTKSAVTARKTISQTVKERGITTIAYAKEVLGQLD